MTLAPLNRTGSDIGQGLPALPPQGMRVLPDAAGLTFSFIVLPVPGLVELTARKYGFLTLYAS